MREGWELKKLGDVCQKTNNINWKNNTEKQFQYIDLSAVSRETLSITESSEINSLTAPSRAKKIIYEQDVIFATTRPTLNRMAIIPFEYNEDICSTGFTVLRAKLDIVEPKYIYYSLQIPSFMERMEKMQRGASYPAVSDKDVKDFEIPLPPLKEQKQIVTTLDKAFKQIDQAKANLEKNLNNAKELFQSKLNEVFSQRGEGWEEKRLEEITTKLGDGLHGTPKYREDGEYYFINGNNLDNGKIIFKERTKRVSFEEYNKYKKDLTERTVFVSINGTLGNIAFYNNEKVILGKSACYFNLREEINKYFIKYFLSSPSSIKYLHASSTGATIKNVSLKTMRGFKINMPSVESQNKIVKELDNLNELSNNLQTHYQEKLNNLEELKKSILQKAFKGELAYK